MNINEGFFFNDGSCMIYSYHKYGTFLVSCQLYSTRYLTAFVQLISVHRTHCTVWICVKFNLSSFHSADEFAYFLHCSSGECFLWYYEKIFHCTIRDQISASKYEQTHHKLVQIQLFYHLVVTGATMLVSFKTVSCLMLITQLFQWIPASL